ncbi:MAG TPA: gamma-glutamylcyclotransferase family protein [Longimicrobium sp.]|nr:gamma-glutamylcyclotransferase family protein [Longimicrobium sp.]
MQADAAAGDRRTGDAPTRLFVYGSLRLGEENPMAALLHANARHLGRGTVCGQLYVVDWYPGMIPGDVADECVTGDLFELHPDAAERLLAELDVYECEVDGFERHTVEVTLDDETRTGAYAYLYAASVAGLPRVAHGDWLRRE